jgi:hypothetical protein
MFLTHKMSQSPCSMAVNSASADYQDTTDCFLLRHDTKFPPTNTQYILSSGQLTSQTSNFLLQNVNHFLIIKT